MNDPLVLVLFVGLLIFPLIISNLSRLAFACLLIGFLQDPIRKIIPGQPAYCTLLVLGILFIAFIRIIQRKDVIKLSDIWSENKKILSVINLFIMLVVIQAFMAFIRTESFIIPIIGLIAYLIPLIMIWLGYNYFQINNDLLEKLITLYVFLCLIVAGSLFLDFFGFDGIILQSVGQELTITNESVRGILVSHTGLMRSSEIAAWHMGTATIATFLMCFTKSQKQWPTSTQIFIPLFILAGIVTGRRKFLIIIIFFILLYVILNSLLNSKQKKIRTKNKNLITIVVSILTFTFLLSQMIDLSIFDSYYTHLSTVVNGFFERIETLGLTTLNWAFQTAGIWGLGAGVASQGAQHLSTAVYGSAEGGLGKIMTELGLIGLILVIQILWQLTKHIWRLLNNLKKVSPQQVPFIVGIVSFVIVHFFTFTIASQAYGDTFILIILGTCLSFVLYSVKEKSDLSQENESKSLQNQINTYF